MTTPSNANLQCPACGADWTQGHFTPGCPQCDGGALDRQCPKCGGRCGKRWWRAIADSQDTRIGHWVGRCALEIQAARQSRPGRAAARDPALAPQ